MKLRKKNVVLFVLVAGLAAGSVTLHHASASEEIAETETEKLETERKQIKSIYTSSYQNKVEARLETAKSTGNYTEEAMLIEQNPYGTNTLSLYVYFETEENAKVSYTVSAADKDIEDFSAVPEGEEEYQTEHEFQVIGLVPDQKNTVIFTITTESGEERSYTYECKMGSLVGEEESQLEVTEDNTQGEEIGNGLYVILGNDSDGLDFMYYYDKNGVIRGEIPLIGYRSHRLLFQNGLMYYSISQTKIAAVNTLGKVEKIYDTGKYELHHDYVFDDDGNLLVLATDTEKDSVEDQIIRIDTSTVEVTFVLDLADLFGDYKAQCATEEGEELDWMHINTIQWLGEGTVLLSSRETSSIFKISGLYDTPQVDYIIGEDSFWEGSGYEELLLTKDEGSGTFSGLGGQHSITYEESTDLEENEYYIYMFNNNFGVSESNPDYNWSQIEGIETSIKGGDTSYFYQYKVNEKTGEYTLAKSFEVPFSSYVSSAQKYDGNIVIDSGFQGLFGEYDSEGNLLRQYKMDLATKYIYRVYKYDFEGFYFAQE